MSNISAIHCVAGSIRAKLVCRSISNTCPLHLPVFHSIAQLRFNASTTTTVDRPDDSLGAETAGMLTNPFGNGEIISGSAGANWAGTTSYSLRMARPRVAGQDVNLTVEGRQESVDHLRTSR